MAIVSDDFFQGFVDAGIVPKDVRRMVIDIEAGNAVMVYYECYGSKKLLELILPTTLKDAVLINVADREGV